MWPFRKPSREFLLFIGVFYLVLLIGCAGMGSITPALPLFMVFHLGLGWIWYLARVLPELAPDFGAILTGGICLVGVTVGLHFFLRWLHRQVYPRESGTLTGWARRRTLALVGVVLLMFVAGIGAVGVSHQVGWLIRSGEPFIDHSYRFTAGRVQSQNNLKQIGLAAHFYHEEFKHFPPGGTLDDRGRGMHGWQTFLLPYVEQESLFKQINLTLPWDHPHNSNEMRMPVPIYQSPFEEVFENAAGYSLSHYAGNVRVLGGGRPLTLAQITDGHAMTILAGEVGDRFRPWGHPRNWRNPALGINTSPDGFGSSAPKGGASFVFVDGSTRFLTNGISPAVLEALSTPNGGEKIPELD
jgi:hypothetical protein